MITNDQGKPFSKRDGDAFVGDYRDKGYLASALFNYLALLGWSPGNDQEILTREEMVEKFTLERVKKGAAQWDPDKLKWMNGQHIRRLSPENFKKTVDNFSKQFPWYHPFPSQLIENLQPRVKSSEELVELTTPFVHIEDFPYDDVSIKKRFTPKTPAHLIAFKNAITSCQDTYKCRKCLQDLPEKEVDDWLCIKCTHPVRLIKTTLTESRSETILRQTAASLGVKASALIHPLRLAMTGMAHGISMFAILEILGKNTVMERIDAILERVQV
jgi:glutamyl/glutaminyl-tRNA synthetase